MALRIPTQQSTKNLTGLDFIYSVNTTVGKNADNKRLADIQLVQLFLNFFYQRNPLLFKRLPKPTGGRPAFELLMDGIVGDQTKGGIVEFQRDIIRQGRSGTIVDGRVSIPVSGLRVVGTNHVFTIIQLNLFFFNFDRKNNGTFNSNLQDHPTVSTFLPELKAELSLK